MRTDGCALLHLSIPRRSIDELFALTCCYLRPYLLLSSPAVFLLLIPAEALQLRGHREIPNLLRARDRSNVGSDSLDLDNTSEMASCSESEASPSPIKTSASRCTERQRKLPAKLRDCEDYVGVDGIEELRGYQLRESITYNTCTCIAALSSCCK